jgi:hypothetical protein
VRGDVDVPNPQRLEGDVDLGIQPAEETGGGAQALRSGHCPETGAFGIGNSVDFRTSAKHWPARRKRGHSRLLAQDFPSQSHREEHSI